MALRFEQGDADAPRGHAVVYARVSGAGAERYVATYCIVLPIAFSMAKYLPPLLAGQMGMEAMASEGLSVMPIPPMLEDVPDIAALRAAAERRDDDLCDLGTIALGDDSQRMFFGAQAAQEYGQLYARYQETWPSGPAPAASAASAEGAPLDEVDVDEVVTAILPERARLTEMARLLGQARYAMEVGDRHALDEATRELRRIARSLPEKYRADRLVGAALRDDVDGPRLAELYLQRAFKLADEDYIGIPPLDEQIRALEGAGASDT